MTNPISYEESIVTFIDVLGFREMLEERSASDIREALSFLRRSTKPNDQFARPGSTGKRLVSEAFSDNISDAIVRARPIDTQHPDGALFYELTDLIHAQVRLIEVGLFVRGAVTLGEIYLGTSGDGPFFGPAVARAYELESQVAVHPRIILDDSLLRAFQNDERLRSSYSNYEDEAKHVEDLLRRDSDGTVFIDYLKAARSEIDPPEANYLSFIQRHAELVVNRRKSANSERVKTKFDWLRQYHNSFVGKLFGAPDAENYQKVFDIHQRPLPKNTVRRFMID